MYNTNSLVFPFTSLTLTVYAFPVTPTTIYFNQEEEVDGQTPAAVVKNSAEHRQQRQICKATSSIKEAVNTSGLEAGKK